MGSSAISVPDCLPRGFVRDEPSFAVYFLSRLLYYHVDALVVLVYVHIDVL